MVEQALEASSSFPLLQAREHVRLDGPHFAAAWRLSFAIHVFGRQSRLARAEQPDKAPAKYAFRLFRRKKTASSRVQIQLVRKGDLSLLQRL